MRTVDGAGASAEWSFARGARTPGKARRLLRAQLEGWGVDKEVAATAELLLSELVTNSVRYAARPSARLVAVGVEFTPDRLLRVEVADASEVPPVVRTQAAQDLEAEGGRGLLLVQALAADWGTCPRPHVGTIVWFTLRLPGPGLDQGVRPRSGHREVG